MKLLQSVQRQFALMGVNRQQLTQKYRINHKVLLFFFSYTCNITTFSLFMYHECNTFQKYAESFFNISTDVLVTLCYANVVFRVDGFFLFIDSCTDIVAGRKWNKKVLLEISNQQSLLSAYPIINIENFPGLGRPVSKAIYDEFSQLIEKWSDITSLALAKGTPICLILPKSLVSFALYFTTDSADKSFLLPLPMW